MKTFLIGYDLNKTGQDYKDLIKAIKLLGAWWHHLDSQPGWSDPTKLPLR
jgi:hypothetical protein